MFFELKNKKVVATEQGMMERHIKELYDRDHTSGKERFNKMAEYIFFVYDKKSMYANVPLEDRKKMVSADQLQSPGYWSKAESNEDVKKIIEKLNRLQFSHKERLLEGAKRKIEEYLSFWESTAIDDKNHKLVKETLTGSSELLELQEKLERMVNEEALTRQVGGGESKLFEDNG